MTAEQALIEENKKDPRVRYLSYNPHKEKIALWSEKPDFDTDDYEFWGSPSSYLGKIPFFSTPDAEYILCIDDIKEVSHIHEKTIETHPIMSISESEREESQKEQEESRKDIFSNIFLTHQMARYFSEIGIPVYSILKNALGLENERVFNMVSNNEIYLKYLFVQLSIFIDKLNKENNYLNKKAIESKVKAINESIEKNCETWACIPTDWIEERNELIETLNNL